MPAAKDSPGFVGRLQEFLQRVPGGALVFAVLPLVFLGYFGWKTYGAKKIDIALYALELESIEVTPQPTWIKSDVRAEVFSNARLDRISLLETSATPSIAQAFETHPWVRTVTVVKKISGGKVQVKLHYRKPVAMVYCEPDPLKPTSITKIGVLPVDSDGVLLPEKINQFDHSIVPTFLWIYGYKKQPDGEIGQPFGDPSLPDALKLSQFLAGAKEKLNLRSIHVIGPDFARSGSSAWRLGIKTNDLRQIVWGHPPGAEIPGEKSAAEKLAEMTSWLANSRRTGESGGSLDLEGGKAAPASFSR